jgi:hypothetical protein
MPQACETTRAGSGSLPDLTDRRPSPAARGCRSLLDECTRRLLKVSRLRGEDLIAILHRHHRFEARRIDRDVQAFPRESDAEQFRTMSWLRVRGHPAVCWPDRAHPFARAPRMTRWGSLLPTTTIESISRASIAPRAMWSTGCVQALACTQVDAEGGPIQTWPVDTALRAPAPPAERESPQASGRRL